MLRLEVLECRAVIGAVSLIRLSMCSLAAATRAEIVIVLVQRVYTAEVAALASSAFLILS